MKYFIDLFAMVCGEGFLLFETNIDLKLDMTQIMRNHNDSQNAVV